MSSITKDARNGKWVLRWRDPDGRQRSRTFARKVDAQKEGTRVDSGLLDGTLVSQQAGDMTFEAWAEVWSASLGRVKPSTAARYRSILRVHALPSFGHRKLRAIRPSDIGIWAGKMSERGLAASTVQQNHVVLSGCLEMAVQDGRLGSNPATRISLPRRVRQSPRFLTPSEVRALLDQAPDHETRTLLEVLAFGGLRFSEANGLRVEHLDFLRRKIHISETLLEVAGRLIESDTKTYRVRDVPLPRQTIDDLALLVAGRRPRDRVFTAPKGGPLREGNWRRNRFDPARDRAALTHPGVAGISPHVLRHTAATLLIATGASVKDVQRILGHASAAMTLDIYAGFFDSGHLGELSEAMDSIVRQARDAPPEEPPAGRARKTKTSV